MDVALGVLAFVALTVTFGVTMLSLVKLWPTLQETFDGPSRWWLIAFLAAGAAIAAVMTVFDIG